MNILKKISIFVSNLKKYKLFYFEIKYLSDFCDDNQCTVLSKKIDFGKKIVIYGFGPYGQEYFVKLFSSFNIIDIYDKNFAYMEGKISDPEEMSSIEFDYVIVSVMNIEARKSVISFLKNKKIDDDKIVFINYSS